MSIINSSHGNYIYNDIYNEIELLEDCTLIELYNYRYDLYQNKLGFTKYELFNKINSVEFAMLLIPGGFYLLENIKTISHLRAKIEFDNIENINIRNNLFEQIIALANNCEFILNLQKNCLLDPEEILHLKYRSFSKFITTIKENLMECKWF